MSDDVMTLAELVAIYCRELALEALGGTYVPPERMEDLVQAFEAMHGKALRVGLDLLPDWWTRLQDPTQIDGRVLVKGVLHEGGRRIGVDLQIPGGPSYSVSFATILKAITNGAAKEAS